LQGWVEVGGDTQEEVFSAFHCRAFSIPAGSSEVKDAQEANKRMTRSSTGVPKANNLKRAFRKLETAYEKPLKLYVDAKKEAENVVHRTPLLCLQLTGSRFHDHVSWAIFSKSKSNCPVPKCGHALTMPLQSRDLINSGDDRLRRAVEANGGDGVFEPLETKVGCYCYSQVALDPRKESAAMVTGGSQTARSLHR
jgi:hypothetical protein